MLGTNEILASKHDIAALKVKHRLRAVSYFSLQSCCTRNPSTRAAINEGVSPRRKNKRLLTPLFCLGTTKLSK